jgi:hypothetical protein
LKQGAEAKSWLEASPYIPFVPTVLSSMAAVISDYLQAYCACRQGVEHSQQSNCTGLTIASMGRTIAVVIVRIVKAVFGAEKQTRHCKHSRENNQC